MICPPRQLTCLLFIALCYCLAAAEARAESITFANVPNTTSYTFTANNLTAGSTYYVVFQLVGGGTDNNSATLTAFNFGGGAAATGTGAGAGSYMISPNAADPSGIGQAGATLALTITQGSALSEYAQQFTAGAGDFSFSLTLTNNFDGSSPLNSFDGFTFLLYDGALANELAFETVNIIGAPAAPVPEPATLLLLSTGLTGVAAAVRRRRKPSRNETAT